MKEFQIEIPLRWGGMETTPRTSHHRARCAMASGEGQPK
jgi:hypothetical protein